eukprot:gene20126-20673_t
MQPEILAFVALFGIVTPASGSEMLSGPYAGTVARVIDGDTVRVTVAIWLETQIEMAIRIRGIDAPEAHRAKCEAERELGNQATDVVRELLPQGTAIVLTDVTNDKRSTSARTCWRGAWLTPTRTSANGRGAEMLDAVSAVISWLGTAVFWLLNGAALLYAAALALAVIIAIAATLWEHPSRFFAGAASLIAYIVVTFIVAYIFFALFPHSSRYFDERLGNTDYCDSSDTWRIALSESSGCAARKCFGTSVADCIEWPVTAQISGKVQPARAIQVTAVSRRSWALASRSSRPSRHP